MVHNREAIGAGENGVVEGRRELTVVVAVPRQSGVVARHGQSVHVRCGTVQFHGRLARTLSMNLNVGQMHTPARPCRHDLAVVDFECGQVWIVALKLDALEPQVDGISGQDAVTLGARHGAVQASNITGRGFNIVCLLVVHARLLALAGSGRCAVVFRGQVPKIHAAGIEHVSTRIPVVGEVHALDVDGCSIHDDALLAVVVQNPIAALHGTSRC